MRPSTLIQEHRKMHVSPRRRAGALTALILAAAGLASASPARAATYEIKLCHGQTGYAVSGVTGTSSGPFATYYDTCPDGARVLGGRLDPSLEYQNGHHATASYGAPAGTSLEYLIAQRDAKAGSSRSFGTPVAHMFVSPGGVVESFSALGTQQGLGVLSLSLRNAQSVHWGATCSGDAGCPAGDTHYLLNSIAIGLRDTHVPVVSQLGGTLRSETNRARTRTLTYSASDAGGGVYLQRLFVNGTLQVAQVVDGNGGKCSAPFSDSVPCKTEVSGSLTFDTAALADGTHELGLHVTDATDDNKAVHGPWTITVDNQPPAVAPPVLTGTAREGDTLTCSSSITGQSASVAFQWLRTATDGSAATEIAGATNAAYTVAQADVGSKLLCRVTATDNGGSTTRTSTITQPPFDGGRTVGAYCTDRPTGASDECGDLDGDRVPNREDDDIDGDGIPNASDIAPHDATRPGDGAQTPPSPGGAGGNGGSGGNGGAGSNGGTGGNGNSASGPAPNGSQAIPDGGTSLGAAGTVKFLLGRETAVFIGRQARWLRSAFTLRGRLTGVDGRAIVGLKLFVTQTVRGKSVALGSTTSGADGSWSYRIPRGPGRTITVTAGDGVNAATMTVQQRVVAHVTLRALKKRVRSGGLAQFRGQLRGGHTNSREKLVEFQVYYRRNWRTIANVRVDRQGRFSVKYRFGTAAYGRYKFRARTMPTDGYPFAMGISRTKASTVRVG